MKTVFRKLILRYKVNLEGSLKEQQLNPSSASALYLGQISSFLQACVLFIEQPCTYLTDLLVGLHFCVWLI